MRTLVAALLVLAFVAPASAFHCTTYTTYAPLVTAPTPAGIYYGMIEPDTVLVAMAW